MSLIKLILSCMIKAIINRLFYGPDNILKPFAAAVFLGLVVVLSLLWFQKGIHVSGVLAVLCETEASTDITSSNALFCSPNAPHEDRSWLYWMIGGIFVGSVVTSFIRNRRFKIHIEHGSKISPKNRLFFASAGGLLVGMGAAIAGGCTSSLGLTGASLLTLAGFGFLIAFFIGGFIARIGFGRTWQ